MLKPLAIGVAVVCSVPTLARAQHTTEKKEAQAWSLQGLREAYCVRFLVDPRAAAKEVKSGFRPIPASQDRTLHPAIQQLIRYQPEFAAWSASNLCFYFADAVQATGRCLRCGRCLLRRSRQEVGGMRYWVFTLLEVI
jgi:hypothetical protein